MSFWSQRRDDSPSTDRKEPEAPSRPAVAQAPTKRKAPDRVPAAAASAPTLIAPGSTFVGEISGDTELFIKGVVKGEINLDSRVIVGAEGRVEGDIRAKSIEIAGKVNGNVHCESLLKVHASGSLEGEVVTVDLDVDSGCFLSGRVQRVKAGEVGKKKSVKPAEKKPTDAASGAKASGAQSSGGGGGQTSDSKGQAGRQDRQRNRQGQGKAAPAGKR
ncbi:MAG: polymer-forming cytoskeletal protein [Acidobacteriota bacterium]